MIKAVLFDMDGVLLDSEEFILQAAKKFFQEKGVEVKAEDFREFIGMGEDRYLGGVAEKYDIPFDAGKDKSRVYDIYDQLVKGNLRPLPGVKEFIHKCLEKDLRIAIATSADERKMKVNLKETGLSDIPFNSYVNGIEVENKKPHPDIYLLAAKRLNVEPECCLVVEDAVSGVEAAKSAGCRCLALTTSFPADKLQKADWIAAHLGEAPNECINW